MQHFTLASSSWRLSVVAHMFGACSCEQPMACLYCRLLLLLFCVNLQALQCGNSCGGDLARLAATGPVTGSHRLRTSSHCYYICRIS